MNAAHLHLMLNHFALVGFIFSFLILTYGLFRSNEGFVRAGLFIILLSGLIAIPTFLTGEPAEEIIEKLPGFAENLVEAHEEAAEFAIWLIGATLIAAAIGLWQSLKKSITSRPVLLTILALNFVALAAIGRTANLGGQISHPEIRDSADPITPQSEAEEEDDDE